MPYKVVNDFKDTQDGGYKYKAGEEFPRGNSKPTKKRIEELSKPHPKYKVIFIKEVEEQKNKKPKKDKE